MLTEHQSSNYIDLGFTYLADRTSVDGKPIESALDHIYRSVNLEDNTYCNKLEDASTDHLPVKISIKLSKEKEKASCQILKRSMKKFSVSRWYEVLEQVNFQEFNDDDRNIDINEQALKLSEKINQALDIIAPKKLITIKPNYVQGLSNKTKSIMKERDLTRSKLRKQTMTFTERKSLTLKYRKLRNLANEKIKQDKKNANKERIAKAKSEAEMWKIVNDITNSKSKESITLMEKDVLITNKKVVANTFYYFFLLTHTLFILLSHKSFGLRVLNKYIQIHTYMLTL